MEDGRLYEGMMKDGRVHVVRVERVVCIRRR